MLSAGREAKLDTLRSWEGLSTAGVNQMPSTVSPQGKIFPKDLEEWEFNFFFLIIGANLLSLGSII